MRFRQMAGNTYELIEEVNALGLLDKLIDAGVIPASFTTYKKVFEFYVQEEEKREFKGEAITNTAEEFGASERTVYWIVKKMRT